MSNTLAIATVSGVLQARLRGLLDANAMGAFDVTASPPGATASAGVYLHLYRVVPSAALQPADLPTRAASGRVMQRPRVALTLHYLMTFLGSDTNTTFDAERLAGLVLTELHARPMIHPDEIAAFLSGLAGGHVLASADLGDQLQRVRLTMRPLDVEDHSRVWSLFSQNYHALSVAWEASLVLLDDDVSPQIPLPATTPRLTVLPLVAPQLDVAVSSAREQPVVQIRAAADPDVESLVIRGSGLSGTSPLVRIGGVDLSPAARDVTASEIRLPLTDATGLPAGIAAIQVIHRADVDPGIGTDLRPAGASGTVAVALVPTVTPIALAADAADHILTLTLVPTPGADQSLTLLLDPVGATGQIRSEDWSFDGSDVAFRVSGATTGTYRVRVTVDGATSLLDATLSTPSVGIP